MPTAGVTGAVQLHPDRVAEQVARQLDDRCRQRGAEEQRLPARRQVAQDPADLGQEAHVQHPVSLVDHEVLQAAHPRVRRLQVVEQATRGGDDHVNAAPERVFLGPHPDAADHRRPGDRGVDRQVGEVLEDLERQLARRRQHQRAGGPARTIDELVHDRQQERGRLAAPGHRRREDVAPLEGRGNGLRLDGRGAGEAEFLEALRQARVQLEGAEWHVAVIVLVRAN
jgi:hypothetical protein